MSTKLSTKKAKRIKKSNPLTTSEYQNLNLHADSYPVLQDFADKTGINRDTLSRVIALGTCGQDTYKKLRRKKII